MMMMMMMMMMMKQNIYKGTAKIGFVEQGDRGGILSSMEVYSKLIGWKILRISLDCFRIICRDHRLRDYAVTHT